MSNMEKNILSIKLKDFRQKNNMTQEQLAEILNVTDKTISKWELGDTYPSIRNMVNISEKLGINIETLMLEDMQSNIENFKINYILVFFIVVLFIALAVVSGNLASFILIIGTFISFIYWIVTVLVKKLNEK